jgi:hypothetical protein
MLEKRSLNTAQWLADPSTKYSSKVDSKPCHYRILKIELRSFQDGS